MSELQPGSRLVLAALEKLCKTEGDANIKTIVEATGGTTEFIQRTMHNLCASNQPHARVTRRERPTGEKYVVNFYAPCSKSNASQVAKDAGTRHFLACMQAWNPGTFQTFKMRGLK